MCEGAVASKSRATAVALGSALAPERCDGGPSHAVDALDFLRLSVFQDLEVVRGQPGHELTLPVGDDRVHLDEQRRRADRLLL